MSLLLDALNKADQERKRNEAVPGINSNHDAYAEHPKSISPALLVAIVFAAAIILALAIFFWFSQRTPAPAPVQATTSKPVQASSAPITASAEPLIKPTTPDSQAQASSAGDEAPADDSVASLYQQNEAPIDAATDLATANPVTAPPANQALVTPSGQSLAQFANIPDINDLPQNLLSQIPSLNYSQHNFNNVGGSVVINGVIRRPNDQVASGIVIEKILEDGIILHQGNFSFKMRALNSWLNM